MLESIDFCTIEADRAKFRVEMSERGWKWVCSMYEVPIIEVAVAAEGRNTPQGAALRKE